MPLEGVRHAVSLAFERCSASVGSLAGGVRRQAAVYTLGFSVGGRRALGTCSLALWSVGSKVLGDAACCASRGAPSAAVALRSTASPRATASSRATAPSRVRVGQSSRASARAAALAPVSLSLPDRARLWCAQRCACCPCRRAEGTEPDDDDSLQSARKTFSLPSLRSLVLILIVAGLHWYAGRVAHAHTRPAASAAPHRPRTNASVTTPVAPSVLPFAEWRQYRGTSAVSVQGARLWCPIPCMLGRLWLLPLLVKGALGVDLVEHDFSDVSKGSPDILLLGMFATNAQDTYDSARAGRPNSLVVYSNSELLSLEGVTITDHSFEPHGMISAADINLSGSRSLTHLWRHVEWPVFLYALVDRTALAAVEGGVPSGPRVDALCPLRTFPVTEAAMWAARTKFVLFLARQSPFPRIALHAALAGDSSARDGRTVDHPGPVVGWKNMDWPPGVQNDVGGKVVLMRRYRFAVASEPYAVRGFVSERLVDVHLSGAVPIYWGDLSTFPSDVFNPARVLFYDPVADKDGADLLRRIHELEANDDVRKKFFAQPVLAPTAQAWAHATCASAANKIARALVNLVRTKTKEERFTPASGSALFEEDRDCEARQLVGWPQRLPRVGK